MTNSPSCPVRTQEPLSSPPSYALLSFFEDDYPRRFIKIKLLGDIRNTQLLDNTLLATPKLIKNPTGVTPHYTALEASPAE